MLTKWHTIPLFIGDRRVHEIDVKLEIGEVHHLHKLTAIIVEFDAVDGDKTRNGVLTLDAEHGAVLSDTFAEHSYMGNAIAVAARHYFDVNRNDLLAELGVQELEDA